MVVDSEPRNQKVTLSSESIDILNKVAGPGGSYDQAIKDNLSQKASEVDAENQKNQDPNAGNQKILEASNFEQDPNNKETTTRRSKADTNK